jgi:hypothetical protein
MSLHNITSLLYVHILNLRIHYIDYLANDVLLCMTLNLRRVSISLDRR